MKKTLFLSAILFFIMFFSFGCNKNSATTITFSSWGSASEIEILKPILKEFENNNPNIKIEFLHFPQNYFQKIHLLFASKTAPDVIFINNLSIPIYADFLEDLTSLTDTTQFYPKALEVLTYNNKLLAIPRDISNLIIYYNKDIFDKYKIKYPQKNWNFDDLLSICENLKNNNTFCISYDENTMYLLPFLMSSGGGILSDNLKSEIINTKNSQFGIKFYKDLRYKYNYAPSRSDAATSTMAQMFLNKKIAMHLSGRWLVPKYREAANFNWDIINFPSGMQGSIVPADASGWAVNKYSTHKKEALELVKFLSSKNSISKFTQSGLIVPARIDVAESNIFINGKPENSEVFIKTIKTSKKTPVNNNYKKLTDKIDKILSVK